MAHTDPGHFNINGRSYWFDRLTNLRRVSKSKWTVNRYNLQFTIEGGRHAGGTSRNWWVDGPLFTGSIECTSLVDCLNLLENM